MDDDVNKRGKDLERFPLTNNHEGSAKEEFPGRSQTRERPNSRTSTSMASWATSTALCAALVAVAFYGNSELKKHNLRLAQLPSVLDSVTGMSKRLDAAEAKLVTWADERDALVKRFSGLERRFNASMGRARKEAQEMIAQAQTRLQQQLDERARAVDVRLSQFESEQGAERARLAKLQDEVSSVRQELAAARKDTGSELASLGERQNQSQDRIRSIARQLARQRVDFEVAKNETREVAAGISLNVTQTNVNYQRFAGWITHAADRRTLWIEDQGVQQPIAFRPNQGGEAIELVATSVKKNGVVGYVLLPITGNTEPGLPTTAQAGMGAVSESRQ
jgi:hypothetical protein